MRHHELSNNDHINLSPNAGTGILRVVLLFGSVAVALGLILVPLLAERNGTEFTQTIFQKNVDYNTVTGSIHASSIPQIPTANSPQK